MATLEQERRDLAAERQRLAEREKALKQLEAEVDKKIDRLRSIREALEKLLAQKSAEEERRLAELAKVYQKMPPDKAAQILADLDQELTVQLLERMKVKVAARILAAMDQKMAARLTTRLSRVTPEQE